jgi:hypothetical protein
MVQANRKLTVVQRITQGELVMNKEEMVHNSTKTKIERYKWTLKDEPGEMRLLNKMILKVNLEYQRDLSESKVHALANAWSWVSCGVVIVGHRDGVYWVIDGQHRTVAARRRSDITTLPCLVFESAGVAEEARGFWHSNTGRRAPSSFDVYRARLAAKDPAAIFVNEVFARFGLTPTGTHATKAGQIKAVKWCLTQADKDKDVFVAILSLAAKVCDSIPIPEYMLLGFEHLYHRVSEEVWNKRITPRAMQAGSEELGAGAKRAAAYFGAGGRKVFGEGMLQVMNKGLRNRIELNQEDDDE